jgi:hypothetical protein
MSEPVSTARRGSGWVPAWITTVLAIAASSFLGFRLLLALGVEDTETLESPLMLSVARQLVAGPWELYGPFGGRNPLVLIHGPLYYRLAGLLAWSIARAGLDPVSAARVAGRFISFLGLLATLGAAYRLARLDGAPARAGWWTVLLIMSAPVLAGLPIAVRPDMLGVALQTAGVLLVLRAIQTDRPCVRELSAGYVAFALAFCIKQQFVVAAAISTGLVLTAWWHHRLALKLIERSMVLGLVIVLVVYGLEELVTGGRMRQAVWAGAGSIGRVHPGDWLHVGTVSLAVVGKSVGLISLLAAAGLATVGSRPGLSRWSFAAGSAIVSLTVALSVLQFVVVRPWVTGPLVCLLLLTLALVVPGCALTGGRPLDRRLWACCLGELGLLLILSRVSTGAWINYAIQAIVFAGVLTARILTRAVDAAPRLRFVLPNALAVLAVLVSVLMEIKEVTSRRLAERAALRRIFREVGRPPSAYFFPDRPGLNRVQGRLDLVYDDWLYPVFESLDLAEPRSRWLRRALTSGPVRVVASMSESPRVDGVSEPLPALGYDSAVRIGPFVVWTR